jgi:DNA-binding CsgD family transcriptional regulator
MDNRYNFSKREREVLALITQGFSAKEIASKLGIQTSTAHNHITSMRKKTQTHTQSQLIVKVYDIGKVSVG